MKRIDSFSYAGEADMLYCRLYEIGHVLDHVVIVEADVTHGGNKPKPWYYPDQADRFAEWADKIVYVQASGLPTLEDAWSRELAQREWVSEGLARIGAQPDDIILHGDVDEIPTAVAVRNVQCKKGAVRFHQRFHPFAVDWLHPGTWISPGVPGDQWWGTVATLARNVTSFASLRNTRLLAGLSLPDAGWHFSWVSDGIEAKNQKIESFCHPEIAPTWEGRLDECWETGIHVDGHPLEPVEVDGSWPRWIGEGHAPAAWFRPRESTRRRPTMHVPQIIAPRV